MAPPRGGRHPRVARRRRPQQLGARLGGRDGSRDRPGEDLGVVRPIERCGGLDELAGGVGGEQLPPHHGRRRARRRRRAGERAVDDVHAHGRRGGDAGAGARPRRRRLRARAREPADGRGDAGVRARVREARRSCATAPVPIIADIHYDWRLALAAIEAGAAAIRINPGTMAEKHVREIVRAAAEARVPARAPGGRRTCRSPSASASTPARCPSDLRDRAESEPAQALVEAALRWAAAVRRVGLRRLQAEREVLVGAGDHRRLPAAGRAHRRAAARRRHRGRHGLGRHHQERRRHRRAAGRRHRRHHPREPDRRPRRRGAGRLEDPGRAGPAAARPGRDLLPDLRPHRGRHRRRWPRRSSAGSAPTRSSPAARSPWPSWAAA